MTEERQLNALRLLEENPEMSQRELAEALGVSVGAANYCLKALVEKPQQAGLFVFTDPHGHCGQGAAHGQLFTAENG